MNKTSLDLIPDAHTHQQLNEDHPFYRELFRRLEKNQDGRIDVGRLIQLLEKVGLETSNKKRGDTARVSRAHLWSEPVTGLLRSSASSIKAEVNRMRHPSHSKSSSIIFSSKRINSIWPFERWMPTTQVRQHWIPYWCSSLVWVSMFRSIWFRGRSWLLQ